MSQKGNISALESQVGQNVNPKSLWIKLNGISGGGGERRAARQHDQVFKEIIDIVIVVNTIIFILPPHHHNQHPYFHFIFDMWFYFKAHVDIIRTLNEAHDRSQVVREGGQVVRPRKQGELFI